MDVSSQIHVPAISTPLKEARLPLQYGHGWAPEPVRKFRKIQYLILLPKGFLASTVYRVPNYCVHIRDSCTGNLRITRDKSFRRSLLPPAAILTVTPRVPNDDTLREELRTSTCGTTRQYCISSGGDYFLGCRRIVEQTRIIHSSRLVSLCLRSFTGRGCVCWYITELWEGGGCVRGKCSLCVSSPFIIH